MTKIHSAIYNIIITTALNIAFFFCNYYPRHIIEIKDDILVSMLLIITNLLHFLLMSFMLILALGESSCIFSDKMFRRFLPKGMYIKKCLLLLAAQVVIDFVRLSLSGVCGEYSLFLDDVALLACWLAAYMLLSGKENRFYNDGRRMIITAITLAAAMGSFALLDAISLQRYHLSCERYIVFSTARSTIAMNLDYMHQLRLVILDCILGATLIIAHSVQFRSPKKKKAKKHESGSAVVFRIIIIFIMAFALCAVKVILCPFSSICTTSSFAGSSSLGTVQEGEFSEVEYKETITARYGGTFGNKIEDTIRLKVNGTIYFENQKAAEISANGDPLYSYRTEDGVLKQGSDFVKEDVGGTTVWIYRNCCLCWEENSKPIILRYEDISSHKEDVTLTAVCERLIVQGNIVAFDYAAEYLKKYDPDFIEPYIKRYADGEFTEAEREFIRLYEYREEYLIIKCSIA